jgi:type IV pilus assembly protein PilQ
VFKVGLKALMLALCATCATVVSAATLQNVDVKKLDGGAVELRLQFDQPVETPRSFQIDNPARIVLDMPDASSALASRSVQVDHGAAKKLDVASAGDRLRMVLSLDRSVEYDAAVAGNNLVLRLASGTEVSTSPDVATRADASGAAGTRPAASRTDRLADIDFRRGNAGEGNVILKLSNPKTPVDVKQQGDKIVVSLLRASVAQSLAVDLDVQGFGTPVATVQTRKKGNGSEVTITPMGAFEFMSYQADGSLTVSVKKPASRFEPRTVGHAGNASGFAGKPLSLNFQDIEVRTVLQLIADFVGMNLVASDTVGGSVTLRLNNVPWDQALDLILRTKGLDKRIQGNVIMVAPAEEIAARERRLLENKRELAELAPLRTELFRLKYATAEAFCTDVFDCESSGNNDGRRNANQGDNDHTSILSSRGRVVVDPRTNSILMTDVQEKIDAFRRLIAYLDIPVPQVQIEARIVKIQSSAAEALGVRWTGRKLISSDSSSVGIGAGLGSLFGAASNVVSPANDIFINLPTGNPTGSIAIGYASDSTTLALEVTASEASGNAEIISQPKVVTADKKEARILQGKEIPYLESTSSGAASVAFKEAVLSLEVTPQITPEGSLILDVVVQNDSVAADAIAGALGAPAIDTEEVTTQVLVRDGETVVIGGIFQTEARESISKVPVLGDIPYVGWMFRNTDVEDTKRELLIFLTPKILNDGLIVDRRDRI